MKTSDLEWVKDVSWHVAVSIIDERIGANVVTLCGLKLEQVDQIRPDNFPFGEKSCETCLRLLSRT